MSITDQLVSLRDEGLAAIAGATDLAALDAVRVEYLGKKGSLTGDPARTRHAARRGATGRRQGLQ